MRAEAGDFWDIQAETSRLAGEAWTGNGDVQHYVAECVGRTSPRHPFEFLRDQLGGVRLKRGLSIGCGTGALERFVVSNGVCEAVDAFDGGVFSLLTARRNARAAGLAERVRYFAADFNEIVLPARSYDIVFFNQSLHHVTNLEGILSEVLRALEPGGWLFMDEYVGPSRTQWTAELLAPLRMLHQILPEAWRKTATLDRPIEIGDPSEAVRSGEIRKLASIGFDIIHQRDYGGNVLSVLYPQIQWDVAPSEFIKNLIAAERSVLASGQSSFYTVWMCHAKRGIPGALAKLYYRCRPILLQVRLTIVRLRRLPGLRSRLKVLSDILGSHGETYWPNEIEHWLAAMARYQTFPEASELFGIIEEIRDGAAGRDTGMIGAAYLAHGDERYTVTRDEEHALNNRIRELSTEVVGACDQLLDDLRASVVGRFRG